MLENVRIECPNCHWEPDGGAHWRCTCGHVWDTFKTTAICPACNKRWEVTQCPKFTSDGCGEVHLHEDWYVIPTAFEFMVRMEESPEKDKNLLKTHKNYENYLVPWFLYGR